VNGQQSRWICQKTNQDAMAPCVVNDYITIRHAAESLAHLNPQVTEKPTSCSILCFIPYISIVSLISACLYSMEIQSGTCTNT
jgi:hypothetical protein